MSATHPLKPTHVRKPYQSRHTVPFGCVTLKMFRMSEAQKNNCSESMIHGWIYDGHYPGLKFIRKNKRVVFVKP